MAISTGSEGDEQECERGYLEESLLSLLAILVHRISHNSEVIVLSLVLFPCYCVLLVMSMRQHDHRHHFHEVLLISTFEFLENLGKVLLSILNYELFEISAASLINPLLLVRLECELVVLSH